MAAGNILPDWYHSPQLLNVLYMTFDGEAWEPELHQVPQKILILKNTVYPFRNTDHTT